jgi:hypothetical protein
MAGIGDRVKVFLETWEKRKAGKVPDPEEGRCVSCGILLRDGNFGLVDDDLFCLNCMKGFQEK